MNVQLNQILPSVDTLHDLVQEKLSAKYRCSLIQDRFNINFSWPKQCVLVRKSEIVGVGIFVNEKTNSIDIDGVVPNRILDRVVLGNYITRVLLLPNFKKMEKEVAQIIKAHLQ